MTPRGAVVTPLLVLAVLSAVFSGWIPESAWELLRFVAAVPLLLYLPGRFLLDFANVRLAHLEHATLSLVLGVVTSPAVFWVAAFFGVRTLFPLWPLLALSVLLYRARVRRDAPRLPEQRRWTTLAALAGMVLLACLPLAWLPIYYRNVVRLPSGEMTFVPLPDVVFHLAIANELTHSVPPQAPFVPGAPLSYHYGMDLLVAMFSDAGRLGVPDLTLRFIPTLLVALAVVTIFCFARTWLGSAHAALAAALLVFLGEDFSFVPGLMRGGGDGAWAVKFFGAPTIASLYLMNPMLPAISVLFAALLCLTRLFTQGERGWLPLTALLSAALMEFKVFGTAQLLASAAIAGALCLARFRDTRLLQVLGLSTLLALPFAIATWSAAGTRANLALHPWPYLPGAVFQLGLWDTWVGHQMDALFGHGEKTVASLTTLVGVALPLYLLFSLGLRSLAASALFRELFVPSRETPHRLFLAVFVVLGPLVSLTCALTPAGYPPRLQYNDAIWFYIQAKYAAWAFALEPLTRAWTRAGRPVRAALAGVVLALSLPSTIEFFVYQVVNQPIPRLDARMLGLLDFLNQRALPGDIVLAGEQEAEVITALTHCRAPAALRLFAHSLIPIEELERRDRERSEFWQAWNAGRLDTERLHRCGARYVLVSKDPGNAAGEPPAARTVLRRIFDNEGYAIYEVVETTASRARAGRG